MYPSGEPQFALARSDLTGNSDPGILPADCPVTCMSRATRSRSGLDAVRRRRRSSCSVSERQKRRSGGALSESSIASLERVCASLGLEMGRAGESGDFPNSLSAGYGGPHCGRNRARGQAIQSPPGSRRVVWAYPRVRGRARGRGSRNGR